MPSAVVKRSRLEALPSSNSLGEEHPEEEVGVGNREQPTSAGATRPAQPTRSRNSLGAAAAPSAVQAPPAVASTRPRRTASRRRCCPWPSRQAAGPRPNRRWAPASRRITSCPGSQAGRAPAPAATGTATQPRPHPVPHSDPRRGELRSEPPPREQLPQRPARRRVSKCHSPTWPWQTPTSPRRGRLSAGPTLGTASRAPATEARRRRRAAAPAEAVPALGAERPELRRELRRCSTTSCCGTRR
mmetsp:Transcript_72927/g.237038  ORF Transcript_72927/g.237038 Transcript_72927/m.237038 type:complete len:244 (-) Transcript_72927:1758-2489(-)